MGWLNRLAGVFLRRHLDRDLNEELQHHIELKERENIEAGMPPAEARYAAHRIWVRLHEERADSPVAERTVRKHGRDRKLALGPTVNGLGCVKVRTNSYSVPRAAGSSRRVPPSSTCKWPTGRGRRWPW
jgi:hypothetical protein